jgi:integrase
MSVHPETRNGRRTFKVRWREGDRNRSRSFDKKRDAELFDADLRRRRQLGTLHTLDAGKETLDEYATKTWIPGYLVTLARATQEHYAATYDLHVSPYLGSVELRAITPDTIASWQASRIASGAGTVAVRHAFDLLASILQRAVESGRIPVNPARLVRKAARPRRKEVRPLPPAEVEAMRAFFAAGGSENPRRDATIVSALGYAGLRPGEALALRWTDVRENTLLIHRSASFGEEKGTKTHADRTVKLLAPLRRDLAEWRMAAGRPADTELVFPSRTGELWSKAAYQSWRRRPFGRAISAAGLPRTRPYDLRHSFASLLLHEGKSVVYVARQLGHDARLTLTHYGHVIEELEGSDKVPAEALIEAAREALVPPSFPRVQLAQA